jgi:hypothetical protein
MTKTSIRKRPGTLPEDGVYDVSRSLDGVRPGRRLVRHLEIRRLSPDTAEGLRPLFAFEDLRELDLVHISAVNLAPLAGLRLERLAIIAGRRLDLSPLGAVSDLAYLTLADLTECRVPEVLSLPASLRGLTIGVDGPNRTGDTVKALIEAVDWAGLPELRSLALRVGGNEPLPAIEVDLGFVSQLRRLEELDVREGVWQDPSSPSPLEPPFDGLPRTLTSVRIDAWAPDEVAAGLRRYLDTVQVSVSQRHPVPTDLAPWTIDAPEPGQDQWSTLGSLYEAFDGRDGDRELATEHEALQTARRRIRAADPALLKRLDFDRDSSSTLIMAPTREDLQRALEILGIRGVCA